MKKTIKIWFAFIFTISVSAQDARILNVPYIHQVHLCCWCWAATCNSIIEHYGTNLNLCTVVEYSRSRNPSWFGTQNCCSTPTPGACINTNALTGAGSISDILNHWGISNNAFWDNLSFNTVRNEINAGRPIMFAWEWDGGGGHALTLRGYNEPSASVYYIDPADGFHITSYSWLVDGGNHEWTGTAQLTTTPNCSDADSEFNNSIYSDINYLETNTIRINSEIINADVTFRYGNRFIINPSISINAGNTLSVQPDQSLLCQ